MSAESDSFSTERGGAGSIGWQSPEQMALAARKQAQGADDSSETAAANDVLREMQRAAERLGARAPDVPTRLTRHVDLFALGCLVFYTLSNGNHPFGAPLGRPLRIARAQASVDALDAAHSNQPEHRCCAARELVAALIAVDPQRRPSAAQACRHPLFWTADKQLHFVREASDRLEAENEKFWKLVNGPDGNKRSDSGSASGSDSRNWRRGGNGGGNGGDRDKKPKNKSPARQKRPPRPKILNDIDSSSARAIGNDGWRERVPAELIREAKQFRAYKGGLRDLLRVMRNKAHHYRELPESLRARIGGVPDGYMRFFLELFPNLLMETYVVLKRHCGAEPHFSQFFE